MVGQHRRWLPREPMAQAQDFWAPYERAEQLDRAFREELRQSCRQQGYRSGDRPLAVIVRAACHGFGGSDAEGQRAQALADAAAATVQRQHEGRQGFM